ncbi:hypothetical protein BKA70DRAFT_1221826 [Coprinopsis sp. MPI-PUGE-AT-0042]|nr:hypothetical protein BKA70DRAFT_1221826 [Coprinopsis sp. MPI-PUGE-AT-0042]
MAPSALLSQNKYNVLDPDASPQSFDTPTPARTANQYRIQPSTRAIDTNDLTSITADARKRKAEDAEGPSSKKANHLASSSDTTDAARMDVDVVTDDDIEPMVDLPVGDEGPSVGQFAPLSPGPHFLDVAGDDAAAQLEPRSAASPPVEEPVNPLSQPQQRGKIRPSYASVAKGKAKATTASASAALAQPAIPERTFLKEPVSGWPAHHITEQHLFKDLAPHSLSLMTKDTGPAMFFLFGNDTQLRVEHHAIRIDILKEVVHQLLGRLPAETQVIAPVMKNDLPSGRTKPVLPYKVTGLSENDVRVLEHYRILNCADFWLLLLPTKVPVSNYAFSLEDVPLSDTEPHRAQVRAAVQRAIAAILGIHRHLAITPDNFSDEVEPEDRLDVLLDTVEAIPLPSGEGPIKWQIYVAPPSSDPRLHTLLLKSICDQEILVSGIAATPQHNLFSCNGCKGRDHPAGQCPFKALPGFHDVYLGQAQATLTKSAVTDTDLKVEDSPLFAQVNQSQSLSLSGQQPGLEQSRHAPPALGPSNGQQWSGDNFAAPRRGNGGRGGRGGYRGRNF